MSISLAEPLHINGLAHIVKSTFHLACPEDSNRDLQSVYISKHLSAYNFEQLLSSKSHQVWVALEEKEPIGLAVMETMTENLAMLSKLYVLPSFQGEGVALELYKTVLNYARACGFEELKLSVYSGNLKAKSFYEKTRVYIAKQV
ncbi:hypothetical protein BCU70_03390 [Vibrio sp. 10N.286.49.C2]|uniref:GNAT family N-acetyltransferase n=1 Tax=unclassified Vibrio TaxID=2614977 RepID=UPI000CC1D6BF|nr:MULTISPECIES: GNAT family N-acetyltransferase [unclassified Vibrio]PMH38326.1 hypothetical protein BCU70_03390 [Vibrio sp. 10N.286.49.C2]PMH55734.1 hypothetical protein BCU66_08985 [Vibrio sp. 10N.286.49.B1]PMH80026.1 hypothetical protein BCU58_04040 [Vibrio sp. 10N.286.48.B7]